MHIHEESHDVDGTLSCPFDDCAEGSLQNENELSSHLKEHFNGEEFRSYLIGTNYTSGMDV